MSDPKQPHERLREDIAAVRKLFASKTFKGRFEMRGWGHHRDDGHAPNENNYCGTSACLAGWLALASKNGFRGSWDDGTLRAAHPTDCFHELAWQVYGATTSETHRMFADGFDMPLREKLEEASEVADAIEARSKKAKAK